MVGVNVIIENCAASNGENVNCTEMLLDEFVTPHELVLTRR